jgi:hypothetical protein
MAPLERIERPSANQNELSPTKNERKYDKCSSNQTYTANSAAPVSELPSILASAVRSQRCPRTKKKQLKGRTLKSDNRSRRRLAGWRSTTGMKWNEVKHISDICHAVARANAPLNWFLTIQPPATISADQDRKRYCYKKIDQLRRKFHRRGHKFLALYVFEKRIGGLLHVHLLVHAPKPLVEEFSMWGDGQIVDIRPAARKHMNYISKQRHPLGPDIERLVAHRRQKGSPFRGRRWAITQDTKRFLNCIETDC